MKYVKCKTVILFLILSSFKCSLADERIILTALNSMERIGQDQKVEGFRTIKIWSARNEVESFQVVVYAPKENINVIKVEISDLIGPKDSKIEKKTLSSLEKNTSESECPPPGRNYLLDYILTLSFRSLIL